MNNTIPAVDKTMQLLEALALNPASQAQLSDRLGISSSTTYRILVTLGQRNWVRKDGDGRFQLANGLLPLLHSLGNDAEVLERARLRVASIASEHGIACKLSLRHGLEQLTDFRAEPPGPVAFTGQAGSTFPLIEGSVGAALLSGQSEAAVMQCVKACTADIPEKTNPELLLGGIHEVHERGCVLNRRKNRWRIAAMSAPLHNHGGSVIAAITLIGAMGELTARRRSKWEKILLDAVAFCEHPDGA